MKYGLNNLVIGCVALASTHVFAAQPAKLDLSLKPVSYMGDIGWQGFRLPKVTLSRTSSVVNKHWNTLDNALIQQISYNVARLLYRDVGKAPQLPTLKVILEDMKGVAYKEGDFNGATIHLSAQYFEKFAMTHDDQSTYDELIGVLYHEIAHAYQLDDHNYKEIGPVIEGIADVVRMKAGYVDFSHRKVGGAYDSGYKTTAFYLHWLEQTLKPNLLVELNAQLDPHDDIKWSWTLFAKESGISLSESWRKYQKSL